MYHWQLLFQCCNGYHSSTWLTGHIKTAAATCVRWMAWVYKHSVLCHYVWWKLFVIVSYCHNPYRRSFSINDDHGDREYHIQHIKETWSGNSRNTYTCLSHLSWRAYLAIDPPSCLLFNVLFLHLFSFSFLFLSLFFLSSNAGIPSFNLTWNSINSFIESFFESWIRARKRKEKSTKKREKMKEKRDWGRKNREHIGRTYT